MYFHSFVCCTGKISRNELIKNQKQNPQNPQCVPMIKLFNFICPLSVAAAILPPAVILLAHSGIQKNYVSSRLLLCLNIKTSGTKN